MDSSNTSTMNVEQEIWAIMPILESVNQFSREERYNHIARLCKRVFEVGYQEGGKQGAMGWASKDHRISENGIKLIELKPKEDWQLQAEKHGWKKIIEE